MFEKVLTKPDGRQLRLYSHQPLAADIEATNPPHGQIKGSPHLRWHPLRGEWVAFASHRQDRTFLPPKEFSPLAVTKSREFPTELPAGQYDVAVFENLSPSLCEAAGEAPELFVPTRPGTGTCEVIVFTQDPDTSLGALPLDHLRLILEVTAQRCRDIGSRPGIQYVLPFENRGVEVGVTLHHPHGQIYAYPFIPPVPARMLEQCLTYWKTNQRGLLDDFMRSELKDRSRVVVEDAQALAVVPVCARYPYETWIAPRAPAPYLHELSPDQLDGLARVLKTMLMKFDRLWSKPFPYLMALFQAPFDGLEHPESHVHFQIYPPYRTRDRLKFLAGTEIGAGMFVNDSWPEQKAEELRAVEVSL